MAISFQIAHLNFCQKSRTPPFPQTNGPEKIFKLNSHDKDSLLGLSNIEIRGLINIP